jgi:hypothetical protein
VSVISEFASFWYLDWFMIDRGNRLIWRCVCPTVSTLYIADFVVISIACNFLVEMVHKWL